MNINCSNIILGSRGSLLAKKHVDIFEELFKKIIKPKKIKIEKKFFKTSGDKFLNKRISELGNKGLFSKEIDDALLNYDINLGIHSLKDIPTILPENLEIGAVLKREDFRDVLLSNQNVDLKDLKENAIIGTSSIRRAMQLKKIRPDFIIRDLRGNVDTRIKKLQEKKYDAIVLASAGLKRLGKLNSYKVIDPRIIIPAIGQGAIALVVNKKNTNINRIIKKLNHYKTSIETECERSFLSGLDGNCQTPVGGYAVLKTGSKKKRIYFNYMVFSKDGFISIKNKTYFNLTSFRSESYDLGIEVRKKING